MSMEPDSTETTRRTSMANDEKRPLRVCDLCGQVDDHPRHSINHALNTVPVDQELVRTTLAKVGSGDIPADQAQAVLTDVYDTTTELRHMDCCRNKGCPDGSCDAIAKTGADDLKGDKLVKHLTSGAVDKIGTELNDQRAAAASDEESE